MQILVVVANIQVRTLKAEVEKGFVRTAVGHELIDPKAQINLENRTIGLPRGGPESARPPRRKGIGINIPESGGRIFHAVTQLNSEDRKSVV